MKQPAPNVKAARPLPKPHPYTVLLLRPDAEWDGPPANWVLRMHVEVETASEAGYAAVIKAITDYYTSAAGLQMVGAEEFAVLAVYHGHIDDVYDPNL